MNRNQVPLRITLRELLHDSKRGTHTWHKFGKLLYSGMLRYQARAAPGTAGLKANISETHTYIHVYAKQR